MSEYYVDAPLSCYFNHQYSLKYYLKDNDINSEIIPFAKNYEYDINFICVKRFHVYGKRGKRYLVTPDITRNPLNGWRLICIENYEGENIATFCDNEYHIRYNNLQITISKQYDISAMIEILKEKFNYYKSYKEEKCKDLEDGVYLCTREYHKDIDPAEIRSVKFIQNETSFHQAITYAEELTLGYYFTRPFTNYDFEDAPNLKKITLGHNYNQVLPSLPITSLVLNDLYNQEFVNVFPNLEYLRLGSDYDKDIPLHLMPNLKTLVLGISVFHL